MPPTNDGELRIEQLMTIGSARFGVVRFSEGPGILGLRIHVGKAVWELRLDLDGSDSIAHFQLIKAGQSVLTADLPVKAAFFDGSRYLIPRSRGNLRVPEVLVFEHPEDPEYGCTIRIFNDEYVSQTCSKE